MLMGQSKIKSAKRRNRERQVDEMRKHISWCQQHVFIRENDTERPCTMSEACEFIYATVYNQLQSSSVSVK